MRQDLSVNSPVLEERAGPSKLLSRLYREVGMAAVYAELELQPEALDKETADAVEQGLTHLVAPHGAVLAA
jgi:hypothetical protein